MIRSASPSNEQARRPGTRVEGDDRSLDPFEGIDAADEVRIGGSLWFVLT